MEKDKTPRTALVLLSMLLLLMVIAQAFTQDLIYRAGDWVKYRMTIKGSYMTQTIDCAFSVRLNIDSVEDGVVTFTIVESSTEKGGDECRYITGGGFMAGYQTTISTRNAKPESGQIFIDPSYTGEYSFPEGKISYHKGVLTKMTAEAYGLSVSIELVDTSIPELKYQVIPPWIVLLVVIPVVVVVIVVVVILLLRKTRLEGAIQTQPSLPQTVTPSGPQSP